MSALPPLPVAIPLLLAALLIGTASITRRRLVDTIAIATAASVAVLCSFLVTRSGTHPLIYWFGGWTPRQGVVPGIAFVVDPIGASAAALAAGLTTAAFVFSWRYFDAVGTLFHVLMLVFLAAMLGFSMTGDLFNLFVFFELMSVSAYALTGYKIEESGPLQGALNFAVTNSIGAFLILWGVSLLYGRTGALNLAQIGQSLAHTPLDALVFMAFILLTAGFFVKAAIVPFHFWLADAHAVAPTPVCILFSGVMVELGIYGMARVYWSIFAGVLGAQAPALRGILLGMSVATALVGALMCFAQRHLKRLLAFSTVSHMGLLLMGVALLTPRGFAGTAIYALAHGLVKASLFLCAGILLHRRASVDELKLHGRGRGLRLVGALFALGGLGLAGLPPCGTFLGKALIEESAVKLGHHWVSVISFLASALTGGAVLRAAGRIFMGWGPREKDLPGPGSDADDHERETVEERGRTPMVMLVPTAFLLGIGFLLGLMPHLTRSAEMGAAQFQDWTGYAAAVLTGRSSVPDVLAGPPDAFRGALYGLTTAASAVLLAAMALSRHALPLTVRQWIESHLGPSIRRLRLLHSGHIGDYMAWLVFGIALFGVVCTLLLRRP